MNTSSITKLSGYRKLNSAEEKNHSKDLRDLQIEKLYQLVLKISLEKYAFDTANSGTGKTPKKHRNLKRYDANHSYSKFACSMQFCCYVEETQMMYLKTLHGRT